MRLVLRAIPRQAQTSVAAEHAERRLAAYPSSGCDAVRSQSRTAQSDAVERPERLRVDEGAGHPVPVRGKPGHLEGTRRVAQSRRPEAQLLRRPESPLAVEARRTLEKDQRHAPLIGRRERMLDQPGADAAALMLR